MARRRCAKLNWNLTKAIDVSNSRSRTMRVGTALRQTQLSLSLLRRTETFWRIRSLRFMPGEAKRTRLSEWLQIAFDNHDTGILSLLIDPLLRGLHP
jgi:hypothetical protein